MVHSTGRPKNTGSPKVEVGEIDTRAPFQSVKDAVNLFGEVAFSGGKPAVKKKANPNSAERVLAKESGLHLAQKELNKLKEQVKNAENTKSEALVELDKAKKTVENLLQKIKILTESKQASLKATESAKNHANQLEDANGKLDLTNGFHKDNSGNTREEYTKVLSELNSAKQELAKIRQDFDRSLEATDFATKQIEGADMAAKVNSERASEISMEIVTLKETIEQVKQASIVANREQAKTIAEKDVERQSYNSRLEESSKKLQMMNKEFDPEVAKNLEVQLRDALTEIEGLEKEVEKVKESDLDSVKRVTLELDGAKESLKIILEEQNALERQIESLKQELERLRKDHTELRVKEAETESIAGNLHVKLRKYKSEFEESLSEEAKTSGATDEMMATLNQLASETNKAKLEAEQTKIKAGELRKEAEAARVCLKEVEHKLTIALEETEEAQIAEAQAREQIQYLSERADAARSSTSESGPNITISKDEFDALSRKAEESEKLTSMKVGAAMAQVEAVKASEEEALQKLEASRKEIEEMKAATEDALRKAEMAEAAKKAVEGELRRLREREEKKAADVASRILAETRVEPKQQVSEREEKNAADVASRILVETRVEPKQQVPAQLRATKSGPIDYMVSVNDSPGKANGVKKYIKSRSSKSKKVLMPSVSGIFHKKRSQVEGASPSYLPGEN